MYWCICVYAFLSSEVVRLLLDFIQKIIYSHDQISLPCVSIYPSKFQFTPHSLNFSLPLFLGIPWANGDGRSYPLCSQPAPHHSPHPRCVCLSGTSFQWPDCHLHLPADTGAMEPGCRTAGSLLHCHRPWIYLPLSCWIFWQWGHRHLCPAVHLLPLGMYTEQWI